MVESLTPPGGKLVAAEQAVHAYVRGGHLLVEDVPGKGHLSKAVDGQVRHSIFVPID